MRNNKEYQLCKQIAIYLRLQYPSITFHFDLAGLNLSRAQAGMMKAIQGGRGWSDLFIAEPRGKYHGLFIELKREGERIFTKDNRPATPHIFEQQKCMAQLIERDYACAFAIGFDSARKTIDDYLNSKI